MRRGVFFDRHAEVVAFVPVDAHIERRIILVENAELGLFIVAVRGMHRGNGRKRTGLEVGVVGHLKWFGGKEFGRKNIDGDGVIGKRHDAPIGEDEMNGGVRESRNPSGEQGAMPLAKSAASSGVWNPGWRVSISTAGSGPRQRTRAENIGLSGMDPPGVKCRFLMRSVWGGIAISGVRQRPLGGSCRRA